MSILNLKNFPDELHREAKIAAARKGVPLREWLIEAIKEKLGREEKAAK